MGAEESTMGGGGGGGRKQQQPRFDVVKLRVVAYTVPVRPAAEPRVVPAHRHKRCTTRR